MTGEHPRYLGHLEYGGLRRWERQESLEAGAASGRRRHVEQQGFVWRRQKAV